MKNLLSTRPALAILVALSLLAAACSSDSTSDSSETSTGSSTTPDSEEISTTTGPDGSDTTVPQEPAVGSPPEVEAALAAGQWPLANRDEYGSRADFTSPINASNVETLSQVWSFEVAPGGVPGGALATVPLIMDDNVWVSDLNSNIYAMNLEDGTETLRIENNESIFGPSGVAVGWGKVYSNIGGHSITAYDMVTGEQVWENRLVDVNAGVIDIQPVLADGKVFAATSALAQGGSRGTLFALDPNTGETLWMFDTIESEDLWGMPEVNSGGGSWHPPAIDVEAGMVYWGTSNPWPGPGIEGFPNGSHRPGDNKWTDSTVALDISTGELVWGLQHREHDLFDLDTILSAIGVYDDGDGPRKVVLNSGKYGRIRAMDPATGELLWDTPVGIHQNDDLDEFEGELEVFPASLGGVISPLAVAEGVVYAVAVNAPIVLEGPDVPTVGFGVSLGSNPSQMIAIDLSDGSVLWDVELPGDSFGGATVVNDLVFGSVASGLVFALDRATGEQVWSHQLPVGINGQPAVAGDTIIFPAGLGEGSQITAFRLS